MRAVLLDPYTRTIANVEVKDYRDISKNLECDVFGSGGSHKNGDAVYVNDEGLFEESMFVYMPDVSPDPYAGRVLFLGLDPDTGESQDARLTSVDVVFDVDYKFMTRDEVGRMYGAMYVS